MIDQATLDSLYDAKSKRGRAKQGKGRVWLRGQESPQVIERMGDFDFGTFQGKVGSVRRSRKGSTRRMPNGSRKYHSPFVYAENPVVAYKLK